MNVRSLIVLLALMAGPVQAADSLGKLFTTPTERANLERLRQNSPGQLIEQVLPVTDEGAALAPPAVQSELSVQGYVRRSDGARGTVWVNHQPCKSAVNIAMYKWAACPRKAVATATACL
ncbi:hypothetical protein [Methylobacillus glycogenes]|uniref:hypothetical protein n=1 Tax=Methylobacillus glycogenes TaxID=406 RepID=UPI00047182FD|nr:hypothetical protein [Methylobacillus glycogenes]